MTRWQQRAIEAAGGPMTSSDLPAPRRLYDRRGFIAGAAATAAGSAGAAHAQETDTRLLDLTRHKLQALAVDKDLFYVAYNADPDTDPGWVELYDRNGLKRDSKPRPDPYQLPQGCAHPSDLEIIGDSLAAINFEDSTDLSTDYSNIWRFPKAKGPTNTRADLWSASAPKKPADWKTNAVAWDGRRLWRGIREIKVGPSVPQKYDYKFTLSAIARNGAQQHKKSRVITAGPINGSFIAGGFLFSAVGDIWHGYPMFIQKYDMRGADLEIVGEWPLLPEKEQTNQCEPEGLCTDGTDVFYGLSYRDYPNNQEKNGVFQFRLPLSALL